MAGPGFYADNDGDQHVLSATNCTLYVKTMLGSIRKIRVKEVHLAIGPYAQYRSAIKVRFKQPRQRKFRGFTQSSFPFVVVVAGDGPEPDAGFVPMKSNVPGISVSQGRYMMTDERWATDFYALLNASDAEVLFTTEGFNPHDKYEAA